MPVGIFHRVATDIMPWPSAKMAKERLVLWLDKQRESSDILVLEFMENELVSLGDRLCMRDFTFSMIPHFIVTRDMLVRGMPSLTAETKRELLGKLKPQERSALYLWEAFIQQRDLRIAFRENRVSMQFASSTTADQRTWKLTFTIAPAREVSAPTVQSASSFENE